MHVVHVNCIQDTAGRVGAELLDAWPTLGAVAEAVAAAGARVSVIQSAAANQRLSRGGVDYHFVAEPRLRRRPSAGMLPDRIARAAAALRPDVIHVNGLGFPFHTRALCTLGVPVLVQDHADRPERRWRRLRRWGLSKIDGVAFTARDLAAPFFAAGLLPPDTPVFAIPESSTRFRPGDRAAARTAVAVSGDPALLWIGRLNHDKDPLTMLDAVALAAPELPGLELWCCYHEAPLLDRIRARIEGDPGLRSRVHLLGAVGTDRIELLCQAADLFVLSSRRESTCFAVIEAMACGATPIVSDIPALRILTGDGGIGALVAVGDAPGFARAIVDIAGRPRGQARLEARAHFERSLSFDVIGRRLIEAYASLIAAGRSR